MKVLKIIGYVFGACCILAGLGGALMRRGQIAVACALATALLVISAGTGQAADLRAQLRRLNLSLPDMPAGFTLHTARYWTNAQAAREDKVPLATYQQRGRLLSYNVEYRGDGLVGLQDVDATVVAYRDERGARWAYERAISNLRQAHER